MKKQTATERVYDSLRQGILMVSDGYAPLIWHIFEA